ncbi:MAG: c-type cytochrome, partial [Limisphaerales bacterium]
AAASPALVAAVLAALRDGDAGVRMAAALAAASLPRTAELVAALGEQLRPADVPAWNRRAALAALATADEAATVLRRLLADAAFTSARTPMATNRPAAPATANLPSYATLDAGDGLGGVRTPREETAFGLAQLVAARPAAAASPIGPLLKELADGRLAVPWVVAALEGLHDGFGRADDPPALDDAVRAALARLLETSSKRQLAAAWRMAGAAGLPETGAQRQALAAAAAVATNAAATVEARVDALRLLDIGGFKETAPTLFALLGGAQPAAVQQAALAVLRDHREPEVADGLIAAWPSLAPALRPPVVNLLVYRKPFQPALLAALESGRLGVGELNLDLEQRRALLRGATPEIRARAEKFVSDEEYANRSALVEEWLAKLPKDGDAVRGRPVFERACAQCHVAGGLGFHVGPDLSGLGHRSVEDLLSNILDPNMAMNPAFVTYAATLADGDEESGILASETPQGITLLQAGERRVEIPRAKLKALRSSGRSLMPEGLEAGVTPQEMRDLIALLQARP